MAPRSNEDFRALENKIKELEKQLSDFPKIRKMALRLEEENKGLKSENSTLQSDNKALGKSGAVINSKTATFDKTSKLQNPPELLLTVNFDPKNWNELYKIETKGEGDPINLLVKYRDGKAVDSALS